MARRAIAAAVYAALWLVSWAIMLVVGAWVAVCRFIRPRHTIPLGPPHDPETIVRDLRKVGIVAHVCDRGVVVSAQDVELAEEWIALTDH